MVNQVIIMRGVSGSGKSTYARTMWPKACVLSSDDFWTRNGGEYTQNFDVTKLGEAHAWNLRRFIDYLECAEAPFWKEPIHTIVIDNTNTTPTEIAPYYAVAQAFKVPLIEIVSIDILPARAFERNTHGVPAATHAAQVERFYTNLESLPKYWNHRIVRA